MHFFLSYSSGNPTVGSLPDLVQSLTTDSCFVDLTDVTLVYSRIVKVFLDVELSARKALLIPSLVTADR